ncbi:MAG: hypothetical protein J0H86_04020 [Xanthomonadaceae bacterium]|nr:hypothetical protein [Xanthomonadaceae bacterium]
MSTILSAADSAWKELNQLYAELRPLYSERTSLESTRVQLQLSRRDTQDIDHQLSATKQAIASKESLLEKVGLEFRTAMANVEAEQKLTEAKAREAEREKEREKERKQEFYRKHPVDDLDL